MTIDNQIAQEPTSEPHEFEVYRERLGQLVAARTGAEAAIRQTKKAMEEEIKPYMDRLKEIKAEETDIREKLVLHAYANKESSGRATFAGIQYRETDELVIDPALVDQLINILFDLEYDGVPLIEKKYSFNKKAITEWGKALMAMRQPLPPGMEIMKKGSVALVGEK